jgi:predicted ATP-dependent endonuclease of OLD family
MELVYLWIEDYKNIKKQGFNFSPRFTCDYDGTELIIKENDDYIENFFGDNINVTAIVGKNGSGKSSVLECLRFDNYSILVFIDEGVKYFSNEIKLNTKIERKRFFYPIYNFYTNSSILHMDKMSEHVEDKISLDANKVVEKIVYFHFFQNKLFNTFYNPKKIFLYKNKIESYFQRMLDNSSGEVEREIKNESFDLYHKFLILLYADFYESNLSHYDRKEANIEFDINSVHLTNIPIEHLQDKKSLEKNLKEIFNLNQNAFMNTFLQEEGINLKNINDLTDDEKYILGNFPYFYHFDLLDEDGRRYENLSHGEKILFGQLLNIYYILSNEENILFLFDEPDLALHPNWQKKYFNEVYNVFSKFNKKVHFIFTTHSPFMLSDIPKQNIIFLDKDEKGNCKVVDGLKEKKQTFGANIHTLLSDSFFMEDGLMGEFAKSNIDKAITLLNQDKLDEKDLKYCEQIISIIGEPIVKNQLQRMLDSKRLKKVDEIDAIKENMIAMQKRLDELEK